jgi:hypothetical protein
MSNVSRHRNHVRSDRRQLLQSSNRLEAVMSAIKGAIGRPRSRQSNHNRSKRRSVSNQKRLPVTFHHHARRNHHVRLNLGVKRRLLATRSERIADRTVEVVLGRVEFSRDDSLVGS